MKVNIVLLIIAVGIAALLGFLVYSFCSSADNACAIGVTSALSFAVTLVPIMGLKHESSRMQVNIKVMSTIALIVFLIMAAVMCFISVEKLNVYYIIVGIMILIYLGVIYSMSRIKDV
ncbi:MAG: hypothetical protein IJG81_04015 [Muribaculaceae bacterium]|nr:hypothetical protein [Muribaculaceae bacterium]